MNQQPELSVVILCYKAGSFVPVFVDRVLKTLDESKITSYELVLVGNYNKSQVATDDTPKIVRELATRDAHIVAIAKEKAGWMGWDMRSGLEAATGKLVAVIDGDGQMPPEDIVKVYNALRSGPYDMAKTYRDTRHDGLYRIFISKVYNFLLKALFPRVKVRDANSKPKIFTRQALTKLNLTSNEWFIDAEIIIRGSYLGFKIIETPTIFYPNANRPSFVSKSAIFQFIKNLLIFRWRLFKGK